MTLVAPGVLASLAFLPSDQGGRKATPPNPAGGHPLLPDGELVTCTIWAVDDEGVPSSDVTQLEFERRYAVLIVPLLGVEDATLLSTLSDVEIYEGHRRVAQGSAQRVTEVSVRNLPRAST